MKSLITITLLFILKISVAQQGNITGHVKDKQGIEVAYANVLLLLSKDSSLVKGNMTDDKGFFSFNNVPPNEYIISVAQMGLQKYYSENFQISAEHPSKKFDAITMDAAAATLNEVIISSKVPVFERKPDKTVVNVSSDLMAGSSTAMDILKKSPGVTVDKDDKVSLLGKSGVMIMIDGKQTYMSSDQLTTLLSTMSADQIDKIELITNPSSKYDAEGTAGIINIKLKKSKLYGTNGSLSANYSQGIYDKENGSINFNSRNEKFNVFGNYNGSMRKRFTNILLERRFRKDGELTNIFNQNSWIKNRESGNALKTGVDYFMNEKNTIGMVLTGNYYPEKRIGTNYTAINDGNNIRTSSVNTVNHNNEIYGDYSANLNYESKLDTIGSKLTLDADLAQFITQDNGIYSYTNYDSINTPTNFTSLKNNTLSNVTIKSAKADLEKPFGKQWKLETGIKSSFVNTNNDVQYFNLLNNAETIDTTKTNHFNYDETIYAAYTTIHKEWKQVTLQLGVRGEQTIAKGYQATNDSSFTISYLKLFPTASVSYLPSANHHWGLSYSKRIDRPDYQDMNPFRLFLDQYTYRQGNPFLKPQFSNNYELSYTYKQRVSGILSFSRTKDNITDITHQNDSTHITYISKENININDNYSFTLSLPVAVGKWYSGSNSVNIFYSYFNSPLEGVNLKAGALSYVLNSSNQIQFKNNFSAQVDFQYTSSMVYALFKLQPRYGLSLAIQKKILHERGTIKLAAQNIVRNKYTDITVNFENMDFHLRESHDKRYVSISFTYKFGKSTIKSSRHHHTGADEEKNRVKKE